MNLRDGWLRPRRYRSRYDDGAGGGGGGGGGCSAHGSESGFCAFCQREIEESDDHDRNCPRRDEQPAA